MGKSGALVDEHDNPDRSPTGNAGRLLERDFEVPPELAGMRLDQALAQLCPDWSRTRLTAWIRAGAVQLDGRGAQPRERIAGGERITIRAEIEPQVRPAAEPIALAVLYRDEDLLVIDKPAGLVVHPGAGNPAGTLQNALLHLDPELAALPRAGIVHRLDKDTSGLLVVAASQRACTALTAMFAAHEVRRRYEAVIKGVPIAGDTIDAPIGRHRTDRLRQAVVPVGGKPAVTHYRVRERFAAHSLVECELETGRTHQIRVHLAHAGFGLVGDPLYGGQPILPRGASAELVAALRGFRRQALHAAHLAFAHPASGEALAFDAPRPADLEALLAALRVDALARA